MQLYVFFVFHCFICALRCKHQVTGAKLRLAANTLCALTVAVIVAFIRSWQLTLLILACVLFPSEANAIQMRASAGHSYEGQHFLLDCTVTEKV